MTPTAKHHLYLALMIRFLSTKHFHQQPEAVRLEQSQLLAEFAEDLNAKA